MSTLEQRIKRREAAKRYKLTEKGRMGVRARNALSKKRNRIKHNARCLIAKRIARGQLEKPDTCQRNNIDCKGIIEAHHPDYNFADQVIWLCKNHHSETHNGFLPTKEA